MSWLPSVMEWVIKISLFLGLISGVAAWVSLWKFTHRRPDLMFGMLGLVRTGKLGLLQFSFMCGFFWASSFLPHHAFLWLGISAYYWTLLIAYLLLMGVSISLSIFAYRAPHALRVASQLPNFSAQNKENVHIKDLLKENEAKAAARIAELTSIIEAQGQQATHYAKLAHLERDQLAKDFREIMIGVTKSSEHLQASAELVKAYVAQYLTRAVDHPEISSATKQE